MRIDRRVSPNQTALWTVYELVDAQTARLKPRGVPRRSRFRLVVLGRRLVRAAARMWAGRRQPVMIVRPSCST